MKLVNDKYYTPESLAKKLIFITMRVLKNENITEIMEPSAGNGAFSHNIPNCRAYDISPEADDIIKADFLALQFRYKKGRLFIGNPPFGTKNWTSRYFFKKCCEIGDYIAFIQPIGQLNNDISNYMFDLIYSIDIGVVKFSDRDLHCCFNIWRRPKNRMNKRRPDYTMKDVVILEYRRGKSNPFTGGMMPPPDFDLSVCSWGNGCVGKTPKYVGQYASELYIYIKNEKYRDEVMNFLSYDNIRKIASGVSMKRLGAQLLYKYLRDNIEGIQ